jgi:hypothetical protein
LHGQRHAETYEVLRDFLGAAGSTETDLGLPIFAVKQEEKTCHSCTGYLTSCPTVKYGAPCRSGASHIRTRGLQFDVVAALHGHPRNWKGHRWPAFSLPALDAVERSIRVRESAVGHDLLLQPAGQRPVNVPFHPNGYEAIQKLDGSDISTTGLARFRPTQSAGEFLELVK